MRKFVRTIRCEERGRREYGSEDDAQDHPALLQEQYLYSFQGTSWAENGKPKQNVLNSKVNVTT